MTHVERRVADLRPGDRTPWYEVKTAPEREPSGRYRVLVRHRPDDGAAAFTDYVRGEADETVPVIQGR